MKKYKTFLHIMFLAFIDILIVGSIYIRMEFPFTNITQLAFSLAFESGDSDFTPIIEGIKFALPYFIVIMVILVYIFYFNKSLSVSANKKKYSLIFLGISILLLIINLKVFDFIYYKVASSNFIEENYIEPRAANITFSEKKNLIYIVLESFEGTLLNSDNGGYFDYNIVEELNKLVNEDDVVVFTNKDNKIGFKVINEASYTTASLITNSSALPFKYELLGKYNEKHFLNGLYTLGDLLYDNGYHNELISSATTDFGALDLYYHKHGSYDIIDINSLSDYNLTISSNELGGWGFNDKYMYDTAKKRLEVLSREEEPFNLTLIGIDTHFPKGFIGDYSLTKFDSSYGNSYATESMLLYDFVNWVREQSFYEKTVIVVMGDHLSMQKSFYDDVDASYNERLSFISYINAKESPVRKSDREYTSLDTFPSILGAMGAETQGDRIGLGTNLFSSRDTLCEEYSFEYLDNELKKRSKFYNRMTSS